MTRRPPQPAARKRGGPLLIVAQIFIAYLMVPTASLAVAFVFGLFGDAGPGISWLAGGAALGLVAYWFALFLGESWIEDLVKSVFAGLLLIAALKYPETAALTLGLVTGFIAAALTKFLTNEVPHRRAVRRHEGVEKARLERRRRRARERAERHNRDKQDD